MSFADFNISVFKMINPFCTAGYICPAFYCLVVKSFYSPLCKKIIAVYHEDIFSVSLFNKFPTAFKKRHIRKVFYINQRNFCFFLKIAGKFFTTPALFVFAGAVVVYKYKKINIAGIAGLGIAVLLLLLAASRFVPPLQLIISRFLELGKDNSTTSRIRMWKLALEMFARHPLIGNGWESFKFEYYAKLSARTGSMYDYLDAHNVYLQVLAETGLLGFTLFIACIGTCTVRQETVCMI